MVSPPGISHQTQHVLKIDLDRVPCGNRMRDAIDRRNIFTLFLETAKKLVPDNKDLCIVFINVFRIDGMVNPVV